MPQTGNLLRVRSISTEQFTDALIQNAAEIESINPVLLAAGGAGAGLSAGRHMRSVLKELRILSRQQLAWEVELYGSAAGIGGGGIAATLTTVLAGLNNDLLYTAVVTGTSGNAITITYTNDGLNIVLSVTVAGSAITVHLATDGGGVITSTAANVDAEIAVTPAANALVTVVNAAGNDGTGLVTVLAATPLTGGVDGIDAEIFLGKWAFISGDGTKATGDVFFRYFIPLQIYYQDLDMTGLLHVRLINRSATAKAAGDDGVIVVEFGLEPTQGW